MPKTQIPKTKLKNTIALLTLLFIATAVSADTIPLLEYKFSLQIEDEILGGKARLSSAAQDYSYIGKYQKALTIPNTEFLEWGLDTLIEEEKDYLLSFSPVNAVDYILKRAEAEQVVILNEAHHKPVHRIFTRQLLKGLYERASRSCNKRDAPTRLYKADWSLREGILLFVPSPKRLWRKGDRELDAVAHSFSVERGLRWHIQKLFSRYNSSRKKTVLTI